MLRDERKWNYIKSSIKIREARKIDKIKTKEQVE